MCVCVFIWNLFWILLLLFFCCCCLTHLCHSHAQTHTVCHTEWSFTLLSYCLKQTHCTQHTYITSKTYKYEWIDETIISIFHCIYTHTPRDACNLKISFRSKRRSVLSTTMMIIIVIICSKLRVFGGKIINRFISIFLPIPLGVSSLTLSPV